MLSAGFTALLAASFLAAGPQIAGRATCPSPAEVAAEATKLVFPADASSHSAELVQVPNQLVLRLNDESHRLLGVRTFEATGDCGGLASAAALVLLVWESGREGPELPAPPTAPPPPAVVKTSAVGEAQAGSPYHLDFGAALIGSAAPEAASPFAAGLEIQLVGLLPSRRFGLVATFAGETQRTEGLGASGLSTNGSASWNRYWGALGAEAVIPFGHFAASFNLDAVGALLVAQGSGFSLNDTATQFDPGVQLGARLAWVPGATQGFVSLSGLAFPVTETLAALSATAAVPQVEVLLALGIQQELF